MDAASKNASTVAGEGLTGLSLASFLQLLAQEGKSCTLRLCAGMNDGRAFLWNGELVDAETNAGTLGLPAAYAMLSWQDPAMSMEPPVDRMRRIDLPLTRLLLEAARHHDEGPAAQEDDDSAETPPHLPHLTPLVSLLRGNRNVLHYYLLDRKGHILHQSSRSSRVADLMTLCIVNSGQAGHLLGATAPLRITHYLDNGEILLIIPGAGGIIGLHLAAGHSEDETLALLRPLFATPLLQPPPL